MAYKHKFGIDFGTTNSSIALRYSPDNKKTETIIFDADTHNRGKEKLCPSIFYIDETGRIEIGYDALKASTDKDKNIIMKKLIREVKLRLDEEKRDALMFSIRGQEYYISDVIAEILKYMLKNVGAVKVPIEGVVFGAPVEYNDACKQVMIKAAKKAGIYKTLVEAKKETEFVDEPVAVALDYGIDLREEKIIFVFDFGGGTLDTTIMRLHVQDENQKDIFKAHQPVAKERLTLGGEKFTKEFFMHGFIPKYGLSAFLEDFHINEYLDEEETWDYLNKNNIGIKFVQELDYVKCQLSSRSSHYLSFRDVDDRKEYSSSPVILIEQELLVEDFEEAICKYYSDIRKTIDKCLQKAREREGVKKDDIDQVLLAGGSSIIPSVVRLVQEKFGKDKVSDPKSNQQLTSIVSGLGYAGMREENIQFYEDIIESDYGLYDDENKRIEVVLHSGTKVKDTEFDSWTKEGGVFGDFVAINNKVPIVKVYQNQDCIGEVRLPQRGSGDYRFYFKVDEEKGWLSIYLLDNITGRWMEKADDAEGNGCLYFTDDLL